MGWLTIKPHVDDVPPEDQEETFYALWEKDEQVNISSFFFASFFTVFFILG